MLFIGTQCSNLYTSVDTPAKGRVVNAVREMNARYLQEGALRQEAEGAFLKLRERYEATEKVRYECERVLAMTRGRARCCTLAGRDCQTAGGARGECSEWGQ